MKHCPECNFSFPDFHRVCDFDGTELVPDPERPSLVNASPPQSRFRRALKSPVLWAGVLLLAVLSSAFLVAYQDATRQSKPVVINEPSSTSPVTATPLATASEQSRAQVETPAAPARRSRSSNSKRLAGVSSVRLRRQATAARSVARVDRRTSSKGQFVSEAQADRGPRAGSPREVVDATGSQKTEVAQRKVPQQTQRTASESQKSEVVTRTDVQKTSDDKDPKLTAMLKTTWRVLKRPFKF